VSGGGIVVSDIAAAAIAELTRKDSAYTAIGKYEMMLIIFVRLVAIQGCPEAATCDDGTVASANGSHWDTV
jgi:hypothetical protein